MISNPHLDDLLVEQTKLKQQGQLRAIPSLKHQGRYVVHLGKNMLNLSSNDYLGLANYKPFREQFLQKYGENLPLFTSSSSRLLTGSFPVCEDLESLIAQRFQRESCLLVNSGYHANIGIIPALADKYTLVLADKLVHASIIDGIRLSGCRFMRYRHNDYENLYQLLEKYADKFNKIIIVTESVFSMDGDTADLVQLVKFKQDFKHILLYVDEAHAVGCYGENGLGLSEQCDCIQDIDILVGTFGKALASMGAYIVCDQIIKTHLVNFMRPLIYSTALPPINVAWSYFLFEKLPALKIRRRHLQQLSRYVHQRLGILNDNSQSHIVPYVIGDNDATVIKARSLQERGFYCLPIRPPTVPKNTSRIRISLTADIKQSELDDFLNCLLSE
ncbi:8-amino-7-oxononanoate synthase [Nicoletella semolina]|uniref:8-amino-7-oxononanoate synthase n=1 Tax=Nicoletella semolina TaxID=271160 RepID=A0A4R2N868_9PAST|nr:8-amino-7-oxononanoate synthase [Nicoletella semolina]MDH2923845.1 8-amino-7-oxononanoate synthase [Nicoletella semolina]TCP17157.1 8-amino-7-oxononanoate synthase [Nicoletella semolina]